MPEIVNTYREQAPASRFIGIKYDESNRVDGSFAHLWTSWFKHGRFNTLVALQTADWLNTYPEAASFIGLMRHQAGKAFEYWIGLFLPSDTPVPAGFDSLDLPAMELGVCWVKGLEPDIYWQENACIEQLRAQFTSPKPDEDGWLIVQERYQQARFAENEDGVRTLDMVFMLKELNEEEDTGMEMTDMDPAGKFYCAHCRRAMDSDTCPECGKKGTPLDAEDPIYIGELPGKLRNALQIAFSATEIPFNAYSTLGTGFTLSAGDIFESYKIYAPYARSEEAKVAFLSVFEINDDA